MTEHEPGEVQVKGFDFNLSEAGREVLDLAATEVDRTIGMTYIRPEILLAATLKFPDIESILAAQGIEVGVVQQKLFDLIKPSFKPVDEATKIKDPTTRLTNNARDALVTAQRIALAEERTTEPRDIFYGVARGVDDYATKILHEVGFNTENTEVQKENNDAEMISGILTINYLYEK